MRNTEKKEKAPFGQANKFKYRRHAICCMKKRYHSLLRPVFWAMITIFVLILLYFVVSIGSDMKRWLFGLVAVLSFIWLFLGILLIVFATKSKLEKRHKIFLILMGASAIGVPVFSVLHNVFYAFGVLSENITWLHAVFEFLHAGFFIISLLGCPIAFIVGAVGSIVMMRKADHKN